MKKNLPIDSNDSFVYQIRISLLHSDPLIWRQIHVETTTTLEDLHYIIQTAMSWEDQHLHQFNIKGKFFGPNDEESDFETEDESLTDIAALVADGIRSFEYEYDFGDGWMHKIEVQKKLPRNIETLYPICVAGEMACPPEDSGGLFGFYDQLEAVQDPEASDETEDWLGDFDPIHFDVDRVNKYLANYHLDEAEISDKEEAEELLEIFTSSCAWCDDEIDAEQEVFSQGVRLETSVDLKPLEGKVFPIDLSAISDRDEPLLGLVVKEGSDAKREGNDVVFQLCTAKCAHQLGVALRKAKRLRQDEADNLEIQ